MQVQRQSLERVSIWDKLSQAINSGLLRVIALKLRNIYEKFYRKLTALVAIPARVNFGQVLLWSKISNVLPFPTVFLFGKCLAYIY